MESKRTPTREHDDSKLYVGYYVVCVLDLLGQKDALTGWASLPTDDESKAQFLQAMKRSIGTVTFFKKTFLEHFEQSAQTNLAAEQLAALNATQLAQYRRFKDCRLGMQQFSDTFVFYAPLRNQCGDVSVVPLYRILSAASMAMLLALAGRVPLRGGITIGTGIEVDSAGFYGPALAVAHHLESKVAEYPRIVLDTEATQLALGQGGFSSEGAIDRIMVVMARTCQSLLVKDSDDCVMVDFMGEGIKRIAVGEEPKMADAVSSIAGFVRAEEERFRGCGDTKHLKRYGRLRSYVDSRLPIWGLKSEEMTDGR